MLKNNIYIHYKYNNYVVINIKLTNDEANNLVGTSKKVKATIKTRYLI